MLGHAIGAGHKVENGLSKAIALPHVFCFNADAARLGLLKVATALGLPPSNGEALLTSITDALEAIFTRLGIPRRLRDIGVSQEALTHIAEHAMGDWFLRGNPRPVSDVSDVRQVLEQAW